MAPRTRLTDPPRTPIAFAIARSAASVARRQRARRPERPARRRVLRQQQSLTHSVAPGSRRARSSVPSAPSLTLAPWYPSAVDIRVIVRTVSAARFLAVRHEEPSPAPLRRHAVAPCRYRPLVQTFGTDVRQDLGEHLGSRAPGVVTGGVGACGTCRSIAMSPACEACTWPHGFRWAVLRAPHGRQELRRARSSPFVLTPPSSVARTDVTMTRSTHPRALPVPLLSGTGKSVALVKAVHWSRGRVVDRRWSDSRNWSIVAVVIG